MPRGELQEICQDSNQQPTQQVIVCWPSQQMPQSRFLSEVITQRQTDLKPNLKSFHNGLSSDHFFTWSQEVLSALAPQQSPVCDSNHVLSSRINTFLLFIRHYTDCYHCFLGQNQHGWTSAGQGLKGMLFHTHLRQPNDRAHIHQQLSEAKRKIKAKIQLVP